jgi:hypothetical protein
VCVWRVWPSRVGCGDSFHAAQRPLCPGAELRARRLEAAAVVVDVDDGVALLRQQRAKRRGAAAEVQHPAAAAALRPWQQRLQGARRHVGVHEPLKRARLARVELSPECRLAKPAGCRGGEPPTHELQTAAAEPLAECELAKTALDRTAFSVSHARPRNKVGDLDSRSGVLAASWLDSEGSG